MRRATTCLLAFLFLVFASYGTGADPPTVAPAAKDAPRATALTFDVTSDGVKVNAKQR